MQATLLKIGNSRLQLHFTVQLHRCPKHIRYYRQLLNHMIEGKDSKNVMPCALEALSKFGENPEILLHFQLELIQEAPGLASALLFCRWLLQAWPTLVAFAISWQRMNEWVG